jgi:anti-anti-sigma factor
VSVSRSDARAAVTARGIGPVTVLSPSGDLTGDAAASFLRRARVLVGPPGRPLVAVDLAGVRRIDSSGCAALVALLHLVQRAGGDMCLTGLDDEARLLMEITRLRRLFDVCDGVPAAVQALTGVGTAAA